jgi:hypothetical protein
MERIITMFDNLRAKPEPYRRAIAFWSALVITAIIALVWIRSLGPRFSAPVASKPEGDSPFIQIGNTFNSIFNGQK